MSNNSLGHEIKKILIDNDLKSSVLCKILNYPDYTVANMLSGRRKIYADEFIVICKALKIDPSYFQNKIA